MNNDNFDDIIKQKADGHQAPVPPDAWDNIKQKKKKRPFLFFWWSLSFLIIIGIVSTAILLNRDHKNTLASTDANTANTLSAQKTTSDKEQENKKIVTNADAEKNIETSTGDNPSDKNITVTENAPSQNNASLIIPINKSDGKKFTYAHKTKISIRKSAITDELPEEENNLSNNDITSTTQKLNTSNGNTTLLNDSINNNNLQLKKDEEKIIAKTVQPTPKKDSATIKKKEDVAKKQKSPKLIIDLSTTLFSPIQNFDKVQSFTRTNNIGNVHSTYTTNSFTSALQTPVAFGIGIRKNINKKFTIGTGLQYAQIKEKLSFSGTQTDTTFTVVQRLAYNNTIPYLQDDTIATTTKGLRIIDALNSYKLYSIPLFFNYVFSHGTKFSYSFTGGAYFTFAQYHNAIQGELQPSTASGLQPVNETNKMTVDIFGGVRIAWLINKNFRLYTEPVFRYNLNKYELKHTLTNKNINQAGVSLGISYEVK